MISRTEFETSLQSPIQFWAKKKKEDVKRLMGYEVAQMVEFDQKNPHHCYDLFLHTLHTVKNLGDTAPPFLRVAAFFHDIGKPDVATRKRGRTVFYGHAIKSAEIAEPILYKIGYTQHEVERICFFVSHHDDFISWVLPSESYNQNNPYLIEITPSNLQSHIVETLKGYTCFKKNEKREIWCMLLVLCRADALSQSEKVCSDGAVIDSKRNKLKRIDAIKKTLENLPSF